MGCGPSTGGASGSGPPVPRGGNTTKSNAPAPASPGAHVVSHAAGNGERATDAKASHAPSGASSTQARQAAVEVAQRLLAANAGRKFQDHYVRATLTSYGASCRLLRAVSKEGNKQVAVKAISKVRRLAAGRAAH